LFGHLGAEPDVEQAANMQRFIEPGSFLAENPRVALIFIG
jgi:hypothetical protein